MVIFLILSVMVLAIAVKCVYNVVWDFKHPGTGAIGSIVFNGTFAALMVGLAIVFLNIAF